MTHTPDPQPDHLDPEVAPDGAVPGAPPETATGGADEPGAGQPGAGQPGADEPGAVDASGEAGAPAESHVDLEALADTDPRSKGELLGELLTAEIKRDEYLDDLRRSHADFENYRRRVMRDGAVQRAAGKAEVTAALLEVLDDLDRTLAASEGSSDADLATGVRLVAAKLADALRVQGLERIDATAVAFDPSVHEAVQQQPGDGIDGELKVVAVLRPGYRLGDRVLRAAMVMVEG